MVTKDFWSILAQHLDLQSVWQDEVFDLRDLGYFFLEADNLLAELCCVTEIPLNDSDQPIQLGCIALWVTLLGQLGDIVMAMVDSGSTAKCAPPDAFPHIALRSAPQ